MMHNYRLSDADFNSASNSGGVRAYAGQDFSAETRKYEEDRSRLTATLVKLQAIAMQYGWAEAVNKLSQSRAIAFVNSLPTNRQLPRCAVDEDGDVLLVWDNGDDAASLTVEGANLHLCVRPGQDSEHIGPVAFVGEYIPVLILARIPSRNP